MLPRNQQFTVSRSRQISPIFSEDEQQNALLRMCLEGRLELLRTRASFWILDPLRTDPAATRRAVPNPNPPTRLPHFSDFRHHHQPTNILLSLSDAPIASPKHPSTSHIHLASPPFLTIRQFCYLPIPTRVRPQP